MYNFMENLENELNVNYTQNQAKAYHTTTSAIVDFFAQAGAMRNWTDNEIIKSFMLAYHQDPVIAMQLLFYFRDIREGQGERKLFRVIFNYLCNNHIPVAVKVLSFIPEYGRWDDIYCAYNTPCEDAMWAIISDQLFQDINNYIAGQPISLLAKWLKSERTHGKKNELGVATRKGLGIDSPKEYRKILSELRKYLDIVERRMSANDWDGINFERVPSQAMRKYSRSFSEKSAKFGTYMEKVKSGVAKINARTLYPYQLVQPLYETHISEMDREVLNEQWKALPNWLKDETADALVVADVSGSMTWGGESVKPIFISISLALYIAERLPEGPFKDKFITFSERPTLQKVVGSDLAEKVHFLSHAEWGQNTNLKRVMELIVETGIHNKVSANEMPKRIIIISDMQFDQGSTENYLTNEIKNKFFAAGYEFPKVVWWNANAYNNTFPMKATEQGVMVSGASPEIMRAVLKDTIITPMDMVYDVVNRERYAPIREMLQ